MRWRTIQHHAFPHPSLWSLAEKFIPSLPRRRLPVHGVGLSGAQFLRVAPLPQVLLVLTSVVPSIWIVSVQFFDEQVLGPLCRWSRAGPSEISFRALQSEIGLVVFILSLYSRSVVNAVANHRNHDHQRHV